MSSLPVDNDEFSLETRDIVPSHLLNRIKCFSELSENKISKIESAEFMAGDHTWKVIIYLDGDEAGKKPADHISVSLVLVGTTSLPAGWGFTAIFNFFLYNHISDNYLCFRGKARRFHDANPERRLPKLLAKESFTDPSNGYVLNDNCVFGAEVFVIKKHGGYIENFSVYDVQHPYEREWEISGFSKLEDWHSEKFFVGGYNWQIQLCPSRYWGYWSPGGRYVSIFIHCTDAKSFASHERVKANCLFTLGKRLKDQEDYSVGETRWFTCSNQSWVFNESIAISRHMHDQDFLVKDCFLLKIRLCVEQYEIKKH